MIHKVLLKFTKILSHEYLEPYGNISRRPKVVSSRCKDTTMRFLVTSRNSHNSILSITIAI